MKADLKYPNCIIHFDASYFMIATAHLSCAELGEFSRNLIKECQKGNFKYAFLFPFIIKIEKGYQKRRSIPILIRRKILSFGKCKNCGCTDNLTIDHIVPISKGGTDDPENFQCLCWICNRKKGPERNGKSSSLPILC